MLFLSLSGKPLKNFPGMVVHVALNCPKSKDGKYPV